MLAIFMLLFGIVIGATVVFFLMIDPRKEAKVQKEKYEALSRQTQESLNEVKAQERELTLRAEKLNRQQEALRSTVISYKELQDENSILKHDLQNIDVNLRKLQLDGERERKTQAELDQRSKDLGSRYLKENVKWISSLLGSNNFANCKQRLLEVIHRCRDIGFDVTAEQEASLIADLKVEFERAVRAAIEHEEQVRIKAQIREEERLKREIDREILQLDRERAAIQAALAKALVDAKDQHSEEVERLKIRLAEAEEKSKRAVSQAQLTKSGHIYVISNIGSFGEGIFKVGMTRRLEPTDRVRELGGASVPFAFDIHMMISSNDAPSLENALHRALHKNRVNKANPRKEFFNTDIETIRKIVEERQGQVLYTADAEALEYRQSISMSDEDSEYIESVFSATDEEPETGTDDT